MSGTDFMENLYTLLSLQDRAFLDQLKESYRLTHSETQQLVIMLRDIAMWGEMSPAKNWQQPSKNLKGKDLRKAVLSSISDYWLTLKNRGPGYSTNPMTPGKAFTQHFEEIKDKRNILGKCPVASDKTRCCNLMTLDAVFRCGYDCSYCSIQSFYSDGRISFHGDLKDKLDNLSLDPKKNYHIGTGQSSDSLMWGNHHGLLENLMDFARKNPNVILELKTKSDNIDWLLNNPIPWNVLVTWSLNTPTVIANEEHRTVNLEKRLQAARKIADKGIAIGFHFHPMVIYQNWKQEYSRLFNRVKTIFQPEEIVLISLGTLTFIKPVLKQIRQRDFKSSILQMPLEETAGKYSYPFKMKKELFQFALENLNEWQNQVYFYLCMEDKELWKPLFSREYNNNELFEEDMISNYRKKMLEISQKR